MTLAINLLFVCSLIKFILYGVFHPKPARTWQYYVSSYQLIFHSLLIVMFGFYLFCIYYSLCFNASEIFKINVVNQSLFALHRTVAPLMFFALLRYIWFGANKYSKVITSKTRHFTHIIFGFYVVLMVFLIFYKQVPNELLKNHRKCYDFARSNSSFEIYCYWR